MCELTKLREKAKKGKRKITNSEWQEAATMDIEQMNSKIRNVEKTMATKEDLKLAVAKLTPIRDKAAKYDLIASMFSPWWKGLAFVGFLVFLAAMAGQNIMQITGILNSVSPIVG